MNTNSQGLGRAAAFGSVNGRLAEQGSNDAHAPRAAVAVAPPYVDSNSDHLVSFRATGEDALSARKGRCSSERAIYLRKNPDRAAETPSSPSRRAARPRRVQ